MVGERFFSSAITALGLMWFKNRKYSLSHMPERALLAHGCLVLPLSVAPRLLGSCPIAVTPGLAPLMVRVHILHKTNQALNNCKCCQFLEQRLKPGCVFCVSNHNMDFGLVSLNFGQALDAV